MRKLADWNTKRTWIHWLRDCSPSEFLKNWPNSSYPHYLLECIRIMRGFSYLLPEMLKGHEFVYFGSVMRGRLKVFREKKTTGMYKLPTYELELFKLNRKFKSIATRSRLPSSSLGEGYFKILSKYSKRTPNIKNKRQTPFKDEYGFVRE